MRHVGPADERVSAARSRALAIAAGASRRVRATLIADDLTGACDAGAVFAGDGPVGIFLAPTVPDAEWVVAAVDTESRGLAAADAARAVRSAIAGLTSRIERGLLFKKIDSTLRGSVGAETEALLSASRRRAALVCPAFPAQGRTVVDGVLLVNGAPAHASPIAGDPAYPGRGSDVAAIVRSGTDRPIDFVPLASVRDGHDALVRALGMEKDVIVVADAETEADLDALARAALTCPDVVLAGSAGLARAVAQAAGHAGPAVALPPGRAWLIVAGSLHPATRTQLRCLVEAGVTGAWSSPSRSDPATRPLVEQLRAGRPVIIATDDTVSAEPGAREAAARGLGRLGARVLAESTPDLVVVTGGDTAVALLWAVDAIGIELSGAPASGLALGRVVGGATRRFPVLTKAGGFGAPDLFLRLLEDNPR